MADQTEAKITIEADKADVLAVITDYDNYPQWIAEFKKVEFLERDDQGRGHRVKFWMDAQVLKDEIVLEYVYGDDQIDWSLVDSQGKITEMDGTYLLEEDGGEVVVTYRLAVDVNLPMVGMFKKQAEKAIINNALKGLKKRIES
jgi:carbon monoxide dehydrogenase subunit G